MPVQIWPTSHQQIRGFMLKNVKDRKNTSYHVPLFFFRAHDILLAFRDDGDLLVTNYSAYKRQQLLKYTLG